MNGIVFFKTADLPIIKEFYGKVLELPLWLDQGTCVIFKNGNMLLGFCQADIAETAGTITFFMPTRRDVQERYETLKSLAADAPKENPKYSIYHFWAKDPEGRELEFQTFEHALEPHISIDEGLMMRRSIRHYSPKEVPQEMLSKVFELCRYSPTARNQQSYYYVVIKQREVLEKIVSLRGPAGDPILASPYAIAVAARGELSRRKVQDACIAAYHLLLAAKAYGLGTCWVTDMDRDEVKDLLNIPHDDYLACLTPIGFPAEGFPLPKRHEVDSFVRYV
ncbi:MAG: nitroreductase [Candidatus Cloacimonetes bacterium HGW-Cloacimonetes-3]|jgi:nitroreductase|nr:MAG: nitroreductase [Candidatus Cloacimonetes bacterium HGW-Cloacimonetes-3]